MPTVYCKSAITKKYDTPSAKPLSPNASKTSGRPIFPEFGMIRHGRNVRYDIPNARKTRRAATAAIATHRMAESAILRSVAASMSREVKVENTSDGVAISKTRELIVLESIFLLTRSNMYPTIVITNIGPITFNI